MCAASDFAPTDACIAAVRAEVQRVVRDRYFGNARFIRNQFEAAVVRQAWRLRTTAAPSDDELRSLLPDDLAVPSTPAVPAPPT